MDGTGAVGERFDKILLRISRLEASLALLDKSAAGTAGASEERRAESEDPAKRNSSGSTTTAAATPLTTGPGPSCTDHDPDDSPQNGGLPVGAFPSSGGEVSAIEERLTQELKGRVSWFRFVRVPSHYYDEPLEFRRACVRAPSVEHLCKTIVMQNTKAQPSVVDCSNPKNSKYYMVILQYVRDRAHTEKLKNFLHKLNDGAVPKRCFNLRLAPGDVSDELSGFEHNAVTPVGIKTSMPIIMARTIAELQPGIMFLGGGEVDLKVGLRVDEFVRTYEPYVVDCAY